uniref:Uncharacterized protein n=1 Tax=Arundo donax TaxID=35708 RepID=A0A0A9A1H2_ARUDO
MSPCTTLSSLSTTASCSSPTPFGASDARPCSSAMVSRRSSVLAARKSRPSHGALLLTDTAMFSHTCYLTH